MGHRPTYILPVSWVKDPNESPSSPRLGSIGYDYDLEREEAGRVRVAAEDGDLHVSFDVDFLDPDIAPAVGTTVPGGATFREAHLVMEMLHDNGRVTSLDIAELNPFLDDRGRTARLVVDLVASLFGKRVMDRPTRAA